MPLAPFDLSQLSRWGEGLIRPEDVAVGRDGRVYATDPHVGAREILPDGSLRSIGETVFPGCCNGISMDLDNRILLANLGAHEGVAGPLERLDPITGHREVLLTEVEGRKLTSCNYPMIDRAGNIWCTNSIAAENFKGVAQKRTYDGFIFVLRPDGTSSIAAEGIGFANGLAMSADGKYLYCCQTFGSNVLRYPVLPGARLGPGEQYGPALGPESESLYYPDGCAFDVEGNLWITLFRANKVVAITPEGELRTLIDDPERKILKSPANVTFGGEDMKDVYIGGLEMNYVVKLRSPVAGMKLAHQV
ncbi:MAG TPA: SMP-30/gluconolactonase/LRE family protein [Novosphingobium sp.]|nr:SMP-30/gluconolactonase/LRE family protein [Novosphingobium sp.]